MKHLLLLLLFSVNFGTAPQAQYRISGRINVGDNWQPKVYLAAIDKLSDYYRTSPDMIVSTAPVNPDGSFDLSGDNLPDDPHFYRLYLMKKQNTDYDACLYVGGDDHNFAHLILANGESLNLYTDPASTAPFGNYEVSGSQENELMRQLASIVYPSFYFYRIKFPTELKYSEDRLHTDLKNFADTCSSTLVALAAVNNTDFDEYFDQDREFYQSFQQRLENTMPHSVYTGNYKLKYRYYANEEGGTPTWLYGLAGGLLLFGLVGWGSFWKTRQQLQELEAEQNRSGRDVLSLAELTPKEREILYLIGAGKSNKEIAGELFVELSTVKTHINKLYAKLGVSNRRAARELLEKQAAREV